MSLIIVFQFLCVYYHCFSVLIIWTNLEEQSVAKFSVQTIPYNSKFYEYAYNAWLELPTLCLLCSFSLSLRLCINLCLSLKLSDSKILYIVTVTETSKYCEPANIFDMKNVGVATPTLQEWSSTDSWLIRCSSVSLYPLPNCTSVMLFCICIPVCSVWIDVLCNKFGISLFIKLCFCMCFICLTQLIWGNKSRGKISIFNSSADDNLVLY